jgi:hypothetical protein
MTRMILVAVVMAVAETAWALYCGEADVNLAVFYAVLVLASAVFFIPGIAEPRASARR